jgi:hypothetical protein
MLIAPIRRLRTLRGVVDETSIVTIKFALRFVPLPASRLAWHSPSSSGQPMTTRKIALEALMTPDQTVADEYRAEYLPSPDVSNFTTDFSLQADPVVGFHVFGVDACPNCHHSTSEVLPIQSVGTVASNQAQVAVRTVALGRRTSFAQDSRYEAIANIGVSGGATGGEDDGYYGFMECKCTHFHEPASGAPTGTKPLGAVGCGRTWMVHCRPSDAPAGLTVAAAPVEVDYRAYAVAQTLELAVSGSLTTVQANAAKWQTALTSLLALLVVTSLVGGRTTLSQLSGWSQALVAAVAIISLLANIWATYRMNLASTGKAVVASSGNLEQLEQADLEPLRQSRAALATFESALAWVAVAIVSALVAMALVWLLPNKSTTSATSVTQTIPKSHGIAASTHTYCGVVTIDNANRTVIVTPQIGHERPFRIPQNEVTDIGKSC